MKIRVFAVTFLLLLLVGCAVKNTGKDGTKGASYNWQIRLSMDPNVPGQCLQQSTPPGGTLQSYPTYVGPVHEGDTVTWTSTYDSSKVKVVFFPNTGSAKFPGTPMYSSSLGNWVRGFPNNDTQAASATLTGDEEPGFNFSYSQVLVIDPATQKPITCQVPDPVQGMGIHVDK